MDEGYGFLFSGAGTEYRKFVSLLGKGYLSILKEYCMLAKKYIELDVWEHICSDKVMDELYDQIAIYTINCSVYRGYVNSGIMPCMLAGYSMGLYSALACGGAVTFETGFELIINAYRFMERCIGDINGSMAVIIGFTLKDVEELISANNLGDSVEIVNENSEHSIVVSGLKDAVADIMRFATEEGALKTVELKVALPYHSRFVREGAEDFAKYVEGLNINSLSIPLISCVNQRIVNTLQDVKDELYLNVKSKISWKKLMIKMGTLGITKFAEVGVGDSLSKLSSFISKSYKFSTYDKLGEM